jgi:membrane protease YdiL (CAAX protease family)
LIFAVPLLSERGFGVLPIELPGNEPFLLLLVAAMVGISFGVTAVADGRAGVRELRRRSFRFLVSPIWYVTALVLLPLAAFAAAVAVEGTDVISTLADEPALAVGWIVEIATAYLLINLWEELAWSGFFLHRMQGRVGPIRATALTTWAQAAIHLPLLFLLGGLSDTPITPDMYPIYLGALFILPLANRTVATWIYNRSGNSVPVVGLTHSAWNLATGSAMLPVLGAEPIVAYAGFAIVAAIVLAATRGRLGYREPTSTSPAAPAGAYASANAAGH